MSTTLVNDISETGLNWVLCYGPLLLVLKEIQLNDLKWHFFVVPGQGQKDGCERMKEQSRLDANYENVQENHERDEVNKRGGVSWAGWKRWRLKKQMMAKRLSEASDRSGDWLQLVVMIAAGRGGCVRVCVCVSRKKACESSAEGKLKSITLVKD